MNLNHTLFSKLTDDEKTYLAKKNDRVQSELIVEAIQARIASLDRLGEHSLEHPNWPLLRAYRDGRLMELEELLRVFNPKKESKE